MNFKPDSIQSIVEPADWWEKTTSKSVERGFLIKAFLPHVDQVPYTIIPVGRKQARIHDKALVKISELEMKHTGIRNDLPVAAMSLHKKEIWSAYRAKKRPCLVLGKTGKTVKRSDRKGMPRRNTAQTLLVVPYYGADKDGTRAGYNSKLIERIRHILYPQFYVDMLPLNGPRESIARFDQLQPVGRISNSYELTGFKLSTEALEIVDEVFHLYMHDSVNKSGMLIDFLDLINENFYS